MRVIHAFAALIVGLAAFYAVVVAFKPVATAPEDISAGDGAVNPSSATGAPLPVHAPPRLTYWPRIATSPPFPKVFIEREDFDFGRIEVGDQRDQTFIIRNDGEAALEISQGDTTCECTVGRIRNNRIPPHQSAQFTLRWSPKTPSDPEEKGAEIRTNDPDNKSVHLRIFGAAYRRYVVQPEREWSVGEVSQTGDGQVTGHVFSPLLDRLEVQRLEFNPDLMSVEARPVDVAEQTESRARSGVAFAVTLPQRGPLGEFSLPLGIVFEVPERLREGGVAGPTRVDVRVTGRRQGPLRLLGQDYLPREGVVSLGSFDFSQGHGVSLSLIVRDPPDGGLKLLGVDSDPDRLQAKLSEGEPAAGGTQKYRLQISYPAGAPRISRRDADPGRLILKTNHPDAGEFHLKVHLTAF
jgi:hypothetical protein